MKRILAFVFVIFLLAVFTACNRGAQPPAKLVLEKGTIAVGAAHSSVAGMEIRIINAVWNDDAIKLDVSWSNQTGYDALYGESFKIARYDNGQWVSCVIPGNLAFHAIGYDLASGVTRKETYGLTDIFDISASGRYRFYTDCFVYEKGRGGESTTCELWAEFTVTRNEEVLQ